MGIYLKEYLPGELHHCIIGPEVRTQNMKASKERKEKKADGQKATATATDS